MSDYIVVLITTSTREEGEKIVSTLVDEKLAACGNIIEGLTSIFFWEEKICKETEALLMIKTKKSLFERLSARVKEIHSYDVPEVIALPVTAGSEEYLDWVKKSTER